MREATLKKQAEATARQMFESLSSHFSTRSGTFEEREAFVLDVCNEFVRIWIERALNEMAGRYGHEVAVDGQRYRQHSGGTVKYHTLCGPVEVARHAYRLIGMHNGPTVIPLEMEAGIIGNATPALIQSVAHGFAMMPLRDYEKQMHAAHRRIPSRSTLERVAKGLEQDVRHELPIIEPVIRKHEEMPIGAASISIGIDRGSIPMAEFFPPIPRRYRPRRRKGQRTPPPPMVVNYRMGYIATVTINDHEGNCLRTVRLGATAGEGPTEMMERLGAEVQHLLDQQQLPIVIVQDGAPELWNLVETWFDDLFIPIDVKLIDRYHLMERLAAMAELIERDSHKRTCLLEGWAKALNRSDTAIKRICDHIEDRMYDPPIKPEPVHVPRGWHIPFGPDEDDDVPVRGRLRFFAHAARVLDDNLGYCRRHAHKMHYASARRAGFPIGSGPTEGGCKSVLGMRLKRSGSRWSEPGAGCCIQLRTLYLNDRLARTLSEYSSVRRETLVMN